MELYLDVLLFTPYVSSLLLCFLSLFLLVNRKEIKLNSSIPMESEHRNINGTQHYFVISHFIFLNILKKIPVKELDEEDVIPTINV